MGRGPRRPVASSRDVAGHSVALRQSMLTEYTWLAGALRYLPACVYRYRLVPDVRTPLRAVKFTRVGEVGIVMN